MAEPTLAPGGSTTPEFDALQRYNGADAAVTVELLSAIPRSNAAAGTYVLERALQAPALEMALRGVLIDRAQMAEARGRLSREIDALREKLDYICLRLVDAPINPGSWQQVQWLIYDRLGYPPIYKRGKGDARPTSDRDALDRLAERYLELAPLIHILTAIRDRTKTLGVLKTGLSSDGRMRSSFSPAGTDTGRWSSSETPLGEGTNVQNITPELRRLWIADPGYRFYNFDLKQAESYLVGIYAFMVCGDRSYLNAIAAGDLHTQVARICFPDALPWTGDDKRDRELADSTICFHIHTYRDIGKKCGHLTNYYGKPRTMYARYRVPLRLGEAFQRNYFSSFPGINEWHHWTAEQLSIHHELTTPLRRRRNFFGRASDDATLRAAIAYGPQSSIADHLNTSLWRLWRTRPNYQILLQGHDAVLLQAPESIPPADVIADVSSFLLRPILATHKDEQLAITIPVEAASGWNWGKFDKKRPEANPDGLKEWAGHDDRCRKWHPDSGNIDSIRAALNRAKLDQ